MQNNYCLKYLCYVIFLLIVQLQPSFHSYKEHYVVLAFSSPPSISSQRYKQQPFEADVQKALDRLGFATLQDLSQTRQLDVTWGTAMTINGDYDNQKQLYCDNEIMEVGDAVALLAWHGALINCEVLILDKSDMQQGFQYLASAFRQGKFSNIQFLSVDDIFADDSNLVPFCQALVERGVLPNCQHLDLGGQFWGYRPLEALVTGLKKNAQQALPNLQTVYLGGWTCVYEEQEETYNHLEKELLYILKEERGIKWRSMSAETFINESLDSTT